MNKRKIYNFIIFIPFAIAVVSFILYFKYLFTIKALAASKVTELMEVSLVRYRNIGVFCLAIGIFLLFLKTVFDYFRIENNVNKRNERVLEKISNRIENDDINYTFNENNIINDLLNGKTLKVVFNNSILNDRIVKFNNYNKDNNVIEFEDLTNDDIVKTKEEIITEPIVNEYVTLKEEKYDKRYFEKCPVCDKVIAKDAVMCVHCGTTLREVTKEYEEKEVLFNPIKFVLNCIIILLCIILILLCFNQITRQSRINKENLNVTNVLRIK